MCWVAGVAIELSPKGAGSSPKRGSFMFAPSITGVRHVARVGSLGITTTGTCWGRCDSGGGGGSGGSQIRRFWTGCGALRGARAVVVARGAGRTRAPAATRWWS